MRVVFWGGPWHDRAVDIPEPLRDPILVMPEWSDRAPVGDPLLRATMPRAIAYVMMRCADPGNALGGPTIARRKGSPPTWPVYVPADAGEADIGRWYRAASRPVVDGPRSALPVLVNRAARRRAQERARARVARRGPLP